MSQGLGVMIENLRNQEGYNCDHLKGVVIVGCALNEDDFAIGLAKGITLRLTDEGQSCCEHRYICCDDDLTAFVGATFLGITAEPGPDIEHDEDHEQMFVHILTDRGSITVVTHNEHNGYYGGFALRIREETNA